jgi:hypothetical protein
MNICIFCKKYKNCPTREKLIASALQANQDVGFDISIKRCNKFIRSNNIVGVEHICFSCFRKEFCTLWNQVANTDEEYIKENYDINICDEKTYQDVGVTVTGCALWYPENHLSHTSKDKEPTIDFWKVIMTSTDGEDIELTDIPEDIAAEIDRIIAASYKVSWIV